MPLMDEFKKEREDLKNQSFKKRISYFWDYYKWWVIGIVAVLVILFVTIKNIVTRKEDLLFVALLNTSQVEGSNPDKTIVEPLVEYLGYSPSKSTVNLDMDFVMGQTVNATSSGEGMFSVYVAAGDIDLVYAGDYYFNNYEYTTNIFLPVDQYMSADELHYYSDYLYYVDMADVKRIQAERSKGNYEYTEDISASNDVAHMEEPVAMGFIINDCNLWTDCYKYAEPESKYHLVGIIANTDNTERSADMIRYLLNSISAPENNQ